MPPTLRPTSARRAPSRFSPSPTSIRTRPSRKPRPSHSSTTANTTPIKKPKKKAPHAKSSTADKAFAPAPESPSPSSPLSPLTPLPPLSPLSPVPATTTTTPPFTPLTTYCTTGIKFTRPLFSPPVPSARSTRYIVRVALREHRTRIVSEPTSPSTLTGVAQPQIQPSSKSQTQLEPESAPQSPAPKMVRLVAPVAYMGWGLRLAGDRFGSGGGSGGSNSGRDGNEGNGGNGEGDGNDPAGSIVRSIE